jgi:hypothetical protein
MNDHTPMPINYVKFAYDGGPKYLLGIVKVDSETSATFCRWQSDDNKKVQRQVTLAHRFTTTFNAAVNTEAWQGARERQDIILDLHNTKIGLGIWIPLQEENQIKFGPRANFGKVTVFCTAGDKVKPLVGINYTSGRSYDLAFGQDITWFRTSKRSGNTIPELRFKQTNTETFIGVAMGFLL